MTDNLRLEREGYFLIEISEQVARLMYLRQASGILQRGGIYMWHPQNCLALWTQNPLPFRATNLDYENYATARLPLGGDVIHGIRISEQTTYTEPKKSLYMWLGECCRQVEAEEVSKSRNKIHPAMYKDFFWALHMNFGFGWGLIHIYYITFPIHILTHFAKHIPTSIVFLAEGIRWTCITESHGWAQQF